MENLKISSMENHVSFPQRDTNMEKGTKAELFTSSNQEQPESLAIEKKTNFSGSNDFMTPRRFGSLVENSKFTKERLEEFRKTAELDIGDNIFAISPAV